ncbi:MAG: hypothetical protein ABL921_27295 [Pirellula sp.]
MSQLFPADEELFGELFLSGFVGSGMRLEPLLAIEKDGQTPSFASVWLLCADDEAWAGFAVEVFQGCS